ncbi:MAG: lipopolysaccharide biosynthesis protein [Acidobacteria bacterium]|nr:lipopolysaccharide biosynthesis protein [Acidobacteriota bacterium]
MESVVDRYLNTEQLRDSLGARSARSGAITLVAQLTKFSIMMGATMILARLLTPQDYGLFYHEPRVTAIAVGLAVTFLLNGFAVQHQALLQRQMHFGALAAIEILSTVSSAAVAIGFAMRGYGYWSLVLAQIATAMVGVGGVWIACRWRPAAAVDVPKARELVNFGTNLTAFHVANYFARHLDNALIGRFWGSSQLGLYDKAYQMLLLPLGLVNAPVTAVAMPALSRLVGEPDAYRRAYRRILEKVVLLTTPGVILMVLTADWIVSIVLGAQWHAVTPIFVLLGVSAPAIVVCDTTGWLFVSQGRTRDMFRWGVLGSTLIVVGITVGLPWGAVGVAGSYAATMLFVITPLLFWYVTRKGPVRQSDFYAAAAPVIAATCAMAIGVGVLRSRIDPPNPWAGLALVAPAAALVFLGSLWMLPRGRAILRDAAALRESLR